MVGYKVIKVHVNKHIKSYSRDQDGLVLSICGKKLDEHKYISTVFEVLICINSDLFWENLF